MSLKADKRICRFMASGFSTIAYYTIDRERVCLIWPIFQSIKTARPIKCVCDRNPLYFQLVQKSCDLKG